MKNVIKNFINDETGASAAEYALILAVIGVAIGGAALLLGDTIQASITNAANTVDNCGDAALAGLGNDGACPEPAGSTVD